jgi:hypothetical protein
VVKRAPFLGAERSALDRFLPWKTKALLNERDAGSVNCIR